jgi:hypothetical protein
MARLGGWTDPRIQRVLGNLGEQERAVAEAYARGGGNITWAVAAARIGADAPFGERVRRTLLRQGKLMTTRAAAATTAQGR